MFRSKSARIGLAGVGAAVVIGGAAFAAQPAAASTHNISSATATSATVTSATASSATATSAMAMTHANFHLHEYTAGSSFLDLGAKGPSFGDELVGANSLVMMNHAAAGSDSFVCTSVRANDSALQCSVVYVLKDGTVTAQGLANITGKDPLFDDRFAVTGGTGRYTKVRGDVGVLQNSDKEAELYFDLILR